jgi:regulatory protein
VDEYRKALNYSFLLLKYRPRSTKELVSRLKRKKFAASLIEKVVAYLLEHRYLDDEEFVRLFVSSRKSRGWGPRKIAAELKKLGISGVTGEEPGDKEFYRVKIRELIQKRARRSSSRKDQRAKTMRYLLAKGFGYEDIRQAMEEAGEKL